MADHLPHLLMILPGLIGVFVGAPLVAREFESGTFRFAWTQGRSRVQWIVSQARPPRRRAHRSRACLLCAVHLVVRPFDAITGRMAANGAYEISGLVFAARTLFGFCPRRLARPTDPAHRARDGRHRRRLVRRAVVIDDLPAAADPGNRSPSIGHPGKGTIAGSARALQRQCDQPLDPERRRPTRQLRPGLPARCSPQRRHPSHPRTQYDAYLTQHHYTQWVSYRPNTWFWHFQTIEASGYAIRRRPACRRHRARTAPTCRLSSGRRDVRTRPT